MPELNKYWTLKIYDGGNERETLVPEEGRTYTFGRSSSCDIIFKSGYVSPTHGTIRAEGDSLTVTDMNSANGIFVAGRYVDSYACTDGEYIALDGSTKPTNGFVPVRSATPPAHEADNAEFIDDAHNTDVIDPEAFEISSFFLKPNDKPEDKPAEPVPQPEPQPEPAEPEPAEPEPQPEPAEPDTIVFPNRSVLKKTVRLNICAGECTFTEVLNSEYTKSYTFGSIDSNDIQIPSEYVSRKHGAFVYDEAWYLEAQETNTNATVINGREIIQRTLLHNGDLIKIVSRDPGSSDEPAVTILVTEAGNDITFNYPMKGNRVTIGRADDNDIHLSQSTVSAHHAVLEKRKDVWYVRDCGSTNGTLLNGELLKSTCELKPGSTILITDIVMVFDGKSLSVSGISTAGIRLEAKNLTRVVRDGGKNKTILDNVSFKAEPGEFVAILGGSGCGKSTLIECLCGSVRPEGGAVLLNGTELYGSFSAFRSLIGYVPQDDTVIGELPLRRMLLCAAKLRLPDDSTPEDIEAVTDWAIEKVGLGGREETPVKKLSGGQRKRAGIAVELLSKPKLFILDEPTSGLDPSSERKLMELLRNIAHSIGSTVIVITHNINSIDMCDKLLFMGKGGRACYYGTAKAVSKFFNVKDIVSIYDLVEEEKGSAEWSSRFTGHSSDNINAEEVRPQRRFVPKVKRRDFHAQLSHLLDREWWCAWNKAIAYLLLLFAAPVLSVLLLSLIVGDNCFAQTMGTGCYKDTMMSILMLAVFAYIIGLGSNWLTVSKHRGVLRREYMCCLGLQEYVVSKVVVYAVMSLVQSFIMTLCFRRLVGAAPQELLGFGGVWFSVFLCIMSGAASSLFLTSLFKEQLAQVIAGMFLLALQILFCGEIFDLTGVMSRISAIMPVRPFVKAMAVVSRMDLVYPDRYVCTLEQLWLDWLWLSGLTAGFAVLSAFVLRHLRRERSR